jgi:hypothetical protein
MGRLWSAFREWLGLRGRLREEYGFHLDRATADLRSLGLSRRAAKRTARVRFGRRNLKIAARELGSDLSGLAYLIRSHRVVASAWLQPAALLTVTILILLLSPEPREILNNVLVRVHRLDMSGAVLLTVDERSAWFAGSIKVPEFKALQSMTTLTRVERYHGSYAWGQAVSRATLPAIISEARRKTGNAGVAAQFMEPRWEVLANPAQSAWLVIAGYGAFLLFRYAFQFGASRRLLWRWLLYGTAVGALHSTASLAVWALTVQIWNQRRFMVAPGLVFALLFTAYLGVGAIQCRYWWIDLRARCPRCFERVVLPLTEGAAESMILTPAVTESVCTHGHGVLVESRWSRAFRPEESPLQSLADL